MKRKLKTAEENDEIVESEGKSKKVKNDGTEDEPDTVDQFDVETKIDMKKFRLELKLGSFYDNLKLFIKKASKSTDVIQAFIDSGGKILELVETIKDNEESSLDAVSNLYHMLRLLIFYTINDENQKIDSTVQALKFLVNRNKVSIEKMLASSKTADKVLMLKVLTIATSLDSEVGRDILKSIDVFAKSTEKDDFSMLEDNSKKKKAAYDDSVRLAFVHFILGFLFNDKDIILRKKILQKRSLFEFFLRDLHQDNFETIKSVLTCLTKNILISPAFNKPEKLKIFTDNAIKSIVKLYEWKGEASEKSSVMNITHQFLLLLLTSKKHGIVFKALSEKRQNLRQLQIINFFKNCWNHEYPSMLVIEIIKSCPDLMQNVLNRLVMNLQPKVTTHWFMCANFTRELIKTLEPSTLINSFSMLEPKKISTNIIKLSISQFILQNINERALIQQESLEIRESSVQLLHLMLEQCCKYLDEVKKITTLKDFEKHRIKFDIINHIFTFYPNIDIILNSLYRSINMSSNKKTDETEKLVKSQLKHTLEILLLVIKNFPSIIEKIPSVIDYLEVLRPIYEYQLSASDDVDKNEDLEIEMKVVKIVLSLQPSILALESEMFQRIFLALLQVYCCSSSKEYRNEAKVLLTGILHNTMLFEAGESLEINIWLETFRSIKRGILKESAATFVKVLRSVKSSTEDLFKWSDQEITKIDNKLFEQIDAADDSVSLESKQLVLSPVLPALLTMKSNKVNRIIEFAEVSTVLLYHSHPEQKLSFIELLDNVELITKILSYIKKKSLTDFSETFDMYEDLVYRKLQRALIDGERIELGVTDIQQLELLIIQGVFCAIQLDNNGKFDDKKIELLTWYIQDLYRKLLTAEKDDASFNTSDVFQAIQLEGDDKKVNRICELSVVRPSKNIVDYIFKNQRLLIDKFSVAAPNQVTKFIAQLTDIFKTSEDFDKSSSSFRSKIISELRELLSAGKVQEEIFEIVEKFPLDAANCVSILEVLVKHKGTIKEFHVKLLKTMIERLTLLQTSSLTTKMIQKVEKIYVDAASNTAIDMSGLETAFLDYLLTFSHNIGDLSDKMLLLTFREDQSASRSFVRLISTIFTRNTSWDKTFKADAMKLKKELMYPLLNVGLTKGIIAGDQLKPIYLEFKSGIIKAIEKPNKAAQIYRENIQTSLKLIELAMPLNECQDLAMKKFKFESSEIYQLKMLHGIFKKALKANQDGKIFTNFMNHWLHLFGLSLAKTSTVNDEYLEVLDDWLKLKPAATEVVDTEVNEKTWETFSKMCLKNGLKSADGSNMLVLLGKVIRSINVNPDEVATIFDMILTHSNFFNVVFNFKVSGRVLKRNLFFLLNILVQKNPAVAHEKHIPIFLSSYQASMSSSDQLILNLLRFYELKCEIDFFDFRPFLFGPTALAHFTSIDDQEVKLMKKSVDDMNIVFVKLLSSFEKSTVENTVNNYPIKRKLAGVPADALDEFLDDEAEMENVYDPGYFLPIFEMVFESSSSTFTSIANKNNLMSLILPALSCEDENMRLLAAHILMKCRESNEAKKGSKDIWIRFYDSLQHGFGEISEGTKGDGKTDEKHFPRAASISTQLLAEFVNILPNSLHHAYHVVTNYLAVRQKFDFTTIPEMLVLFHSSEVHQEEQRLFILDVICNGIKDDLDFKLLNNTPLLKVIFSCYGCPMSDRKIDFSILKIVDRIVSKTSKVEFLIQRYGLALWIFQVAVKVEAFEYDVIDLILTLIEHTFDAIRREVKAGDDASCKRLLASLLVLLPKFTKTRLTTASFGSFLKTINGVAQFSHISKEHHDLTLDLMKIFLSDNLLQHVTYIDDHPEACPYATTKENFSKSLQPSVDSATKKILVESRDFMMNYHKK